jgi:hypothetical protein
MNAVLGSLTAYGLAGLRDTAHAIALNASFAALQGLAGTQLLIACVWMTSNQVRASLSSVMATRDCKAFRSRMFYLEEIP